LSPNGIKVEQRSQTLKLLAREGATVFVSSEFEHHQQIGFEACVVLLCFHRNQTERVVVWAFVLPADFVLVTESNGCSVQDSSSASKSIGCNGLMFAAYTVPCSEASL
jgi:hypothetical protein